MEEFTDLIDAATGRALDARQQMCRLVEITQRAEAALRAMRNTADPMPAYAALDFVQDVTDDRTAALQAIRRSLVVELSNSRPELGQGSSQRPELHYRAGKAAGELDNGLYDDARSTLDWILSRAKERRSWVAEGTGEVRDDGFRDAPAWCRWCQEAFNAIGLCLQLADAFDAGA